MFFTKKHKNDLIKMFEKIDGDIGTLYGEIEILKRKYDLILEKLNTKKTKGCKNEKI